MSHRYVSVQWNRHKRVYDAVLLVFVVVVMASVVLGAKLTQTAPALVSDEILVMRALGITSILLLHIILAIGPLARLDARFAPLLYNRRHMGVTMFFIGLAHAALATLYYGGFGNTDPFSALFNEFGFQSFGLLSLLILFLMAATSHDFWLKNLGPVWWKTLHMGVYVAYASLLLHVAWGTMQDERSLSLPISLGGGLALLSTLHIWAGWKQRATDRASEGVETDAGWVEVCGVDDIEPERAVGVCLKDGRRAAVYRYTKDGNELVSAMDDRCAHQGGPLSEGKVVDGCVTCPWHGYQYLPENAQSPPPFTEKLSTYRVRLTAGRVEIDPEALAPGTPVEPVVIGPANGGSKP